MRKILLLLFSFVTLSLSAQSYFVKVGGGLGSQWGAAGVVGAGKIGFGYEYEFNQVLTIAPTIGITTRGWQVSDVNTPDMLFDADGNRLDKNGDVTDEPRNQAQRYLQDSDGNNVAPMYSMMHRVYTTNYLQFDLPLNYYLRLGEHRYVTFTAGVWGAFGIAGKRKTEGDGYAAGNNKVKYTDKTFKLDGAHRFDAGLKAGIGYQFPSSLTINVEGEFGLLKTNALGTPIANPYSTDITDDEYYHAADAFAGRAGRSFSVMITLSYKLNKIKWRGED